jgi:hypothetical protein
LGWCLDRGDAEIAENTRRITTEASEEGAEGFCLLTLSAAAG